MLDLINEETARLEYEQSELNKYKAKKLSDAQINYTEKRQLIINDRLKQNDWMQKLTHGLYNLVDQEREDGYRAGYRAASQTNSAIEITYDKELIRARSITECLEKWADHF